MGGVGWVGWGGVGGVGGVVWVGWGGWRCAVDLAGPYGCQTGWGGVGGWGWMPSGEGRGSTVRGTEPLLIVNNCDSLNNGVLPMSY